MMEVLDFLNLLCPWTSPSYISGNSLYNCEVCGGASIPILDKETKSASSLMSSLIQMREICRKFLLTWIQPHYYTHSVHAHKTTHRKTVEKLCVKYWRPSVSFCAVETGTWIHVWMMKDMAYVECISHSRTWMEMIWKIKLENSKDLFSLH